MAGEEKQTRVLYKAVADFSDLAKKARAARREVDALKKEEAALNAESAKGAATSEKARKRDVAASKTQAAALKTVAEASKDAASSTAEHAKATEDSVSSNRRAAAATDTHSRSVSALDRVLNAARNTMERLNTSTGKHSASQRRNQQETSRTGSIMQNVRRQAESLNKSLDRLGNWRPRLMPPFIALIPVIGSVLALINPLVAGLGAVGAAAVGMAANLGSIAGAAIGVIPALAALLSVVGAIKVAFGGIGGVFKKYTASRDAAAKAGGGGGGSQRIELTQTEQIARANEKLRRSVEDVQFAQDDLDDARKGYINRLNELRRAIDRAALSEARAAANTQLAREEYANVLADPGSTKGQKMAAQAALEEARNDQQDVADENKKNADDLAEMQRKGIEGDRDVIQAKRRVVDAMWSQRDAEIDLQNAIKGTDKASSAAATAAREYENALDALSPSARKVVEALIAMEDEWKSLKRTVQESFFSNLADGMDRLYRLLGPVTSLLSDTAGALGRVADKALGVLTSDEWLDDFYALGKQNVPIIENMGDALLYVLGALKDLTFAAGPFVTTLSEGLRDGASNFADLVSSARETGRLAGWLETVNTRMQQWWRIIKNIGTALFNYGAAAGDFGQWITDSFERVTEGWVSSSERAREAGSPFREYLEEIKPLLSEVSGLLGDFFGWFTDQATDSDNITQFTEITKMLREDLGPALSDILDTMSKSGMGEDLIRGIVTILETIDTFLQNGGAEGMGAFWDTLTSIFKTVQDIVEVLPPQVVAGFTTALGTIAALRFTGLTSLLGLLLRLGKSDVLGRLTGGFLDDLIGVGGGAGRHAAGRTGLLSRLFGRTAASAGGRAAAGAAGAGAAEAVGGVAAGAAAGAATRGGVGGFLSRLGGRAAGGAGRGGIIGSIAGLIAGTLSDELIRDGQGGARDTGGSLLSGAATGAGIGAAVGSVVPGIGTAVGALAGGAIGTGAAALGIDGDQWSNTIDELKDAWSGFTTWLDESTQGIQDWFADLPGNIAEWAGNIWENIQGIPTWLGEQWTAFTQWLGELPEKIAFAAGYLWGSLQNIGIWLAGQWDNFQQWLSELPQKIAELGQSIWNGLQNIGQWLVTQWTNFTQWLSTLPQKIAELGQTIWNGLQNIGQWLTTQWTNFSSWVSDIPNKIARLGINIWNGLGSIGQWLSTQWTTFRDWLSDLPGRVSSAFTGGQNAARDKGRSNAGGRVLRRSSGGGVPGEGNGDTVSAMLTPGEFVLRKAIVNKIGPDNLQRLNSGVLSFASMLRNANSRSRSTLSGGDAGIQFFETGGIVPSGTNFGPGGTPPVNPVGGGGNITVENLNIINPAPETSSDSLPRAIRRLAYLGRSS